MKAATDNVDKCDVTGLMHIMQGFRQKQNKGLY